MTETRALRVPFQALAQRTGISPSNAQARIAELCETGTIIKLSNPTGNRYRISDNVPLMFGAEDDPETWELELQEITLADPTQIERLTCLDPHIKRRKELKEQTTTPSEISQRPSRSHRPVVETSSPNKNATESDLNQVDHGNESPASGARKTAISGEDLAFAAQVGSKTARQWVGRFGLERCQEVWGKAQSARNAGGYMRRALEENWMWGESWKQGVELAEPARPYLIDHTASMARAAELAGITLETETAVCQLDRDAFKNLRKLVAGVVE